MSDTGSRLHLFVDLGDTFTKSIALGSARRERVRFPSAVASRLVSGGAEMSELLLDGSASVPRLPSFDAEAFPRTRSFPRGEELAQKVRRQPAPANARFAGRIAAMYGADRRLLGREPNIESVDALVHKALILSGVEDRCEADVTFVLDGGAKAAVVGQYAAEPRVASVELRSYSHQQTRRLSFSVRGRVVDAPDCIRAALAPELDPSRDGPLLAVDVGHFRTKLAVLAAEGCVHREEVHDLGVFDVVRRILRDGQEQGLVEDEFAVMRAIERGDGEQIEVAGRRFEIGATLRSALAALEQELARVVERVALEHFQRVGRSCRGLVVLGGGAALAGAGLVTRLRDARIGLERCQVAADPSFLLALGARRLGALKSRGA